MTKKIKIDIVSDVVCPWCTVGYKYLEKAINELGIKDQITIAWQPFELNPYMPEDGQNLNEHITEKYGSSEAQLKASRERLIEAGASVDFDFNFYDDMRMVNTFDAHILLEYAKDFDKQTELKMRLTTAFFSEKKDISKVDVLHQALLDVGLNATEGIAKLHLKDARNAIKSQKEYWQNMGINSVPTFIFNKTDGVTGAHPVETFKKILQEYL